MAKCDGWKTTQRCPHCGEQFVLDCEPNSEECPVCEDEMTWNSDLKRYECDNCGNAEFDAEPTECFRCGREWPFEKAVEKADVR